MVQPFIVMKTVCSVIKHRYTPWHAKYCTSEKFKRKIKVQKDPTKVKKYCVYLSFDKKTEQIITDLRLVMAHEIKGVKSPLGKMAPHITVGIINTDDQQKLFRNFDEFSKQVNKFDIDLEKINCFNSRKNRVLFVEPILSEDLKRTLLSFVDNFDKEEIGSYHDIDRWSPHCTLAKRLTEEAFVAAKELAERCWMSITASTFSVGVVDIMKTTEILRYKLLSANDENDKQDELPNITAKQISKD